MNADQGKLLAFDQVTFSPNAADPEPIEKDLRKLTASEQGLAEVTAVDLPSCFPQDSFADILPEGALGEMTALGQTVKTWWV